MIKYNKKPLELWYAVSNGNYEVRLSITAQEQAVYTVYSQNRRFAAEDQQIHAGETQTLTFLVNVCDYFRRDRSYKVDGIELQIVCDQAVTAAASVTPVDVPTLYILGDSTVTDQPSEYPYDPEKTYCGWGQMIPMLFDNAVAVSNHSESGATTAEAREIHFNGVRDKLRPGDYLMLEFGHNDQKQPELDASGGYADNLRWFVEYAKSRGAQPILNAPINRIIYDEKGKIVNLLGDYRNAVWSVAKELNVPFIDLFTATTEFFEPLGLYTAKKYFRHDEESQDYTHTNDLGGAIVARLCAGLIQNARIDGLSQHVLPDRLAIDKIEVSPDAPRESNIGEFKRLKSIGLGTVPADLDDDISGI